MTAHCCGLNNPDENNNKKNTEKQTKERWFS